jgi:hypothetical protein
MGIVFYFGVAFEAARKCELLGFMGFTLDLSSGSLVIPLTKRNFDFPR